MFDPLSNRFLIIAMLALLAVALLSDIRIRRIPNRYVIIGLLLGLIGHASSAGFAGLIVAVSGTLVGLLCLLPFYISGGMGAGDVKLMAMCGAFLGPLQVVMASVASLIVGGVIGVLLAFWQFSTGGDDRVVEDGRSATTVPLFRNQALAASSIPYALAITAGVLIALKVAPVILLSLKGGITS